jgi:hypothetical protein
VNRWVFLSVVVIVAAFAIYTFAWREDSGADDPKLARIYAEDRVGSCGGTTCRLVSVKPISDRLYKVQAVAAEGDMWCYVIDVPRYKNLGSNDYESAYAAEC